MKILTFLVVISLAAFQTSFAQDQLPEISVTDLEGNSKELQEEVKDNAFTILSFWATWCKPCKSELDAISNVYADWQSKYDVELLAISIDDKRTNRRVPSLLKQKNWPYTFFMDPNQEAQRALGFRTIPQTFLVDKEGNILYAHNGYTEGAEFELEETMKAHQ